MNKLKSDYNKLILIDNEFNNFMENFQWFLLTYKQLASEHSKYLIRKTKIYFWKIQKILCNFLKKNVKISLNYTSFRMKINEKLLKNKNNCFWKI